MVMAGKMNKILTKIICKIFGHIYPSKEVAIPTHIKKLDPTLELFRADTSKPCHRCGIIIKD